MKAVIVEDSPGVAQRLAEILTKAGMEVVGTAAGEDDALELVDRHRIDFALIDLQLAQGTGFAVIRSLRRLGRDPVCIVVLTNHAVPALKVATFEAGADYFLDKAKGFAYLDRVVHEVMQKESANG